jgi:alpha-methylacyl-CoA racemase
VRRSKGWIGLQASRPVAPLNLVGDFGGGGMLLAFGIACALTERATSGKGQVVDAAMVDGASSLMGMLYSMKAMGVWTEERGTNLLDSGAHFYDTFETKDGKWVAIGSIEPQFYALLLKHTGLDQEDLPPQMDRTRWAEVKPRMIEIFKSKTRDEWCDIMEGTDVCFAPVLNMEEAPQHPHLKQRETFVELAGVVQPAPSPRFDRTPPEIAGPPAHPGQHTNAVLGDFGFSADEIASLRKANAVA